MNLQQCRYVAEIAAAGSFSEAAKRLYVTQPSLSQAVRELEAELEAELFVRSKSGAQLTEAGRDFLVYAKQILAQTEQLQRHFQRGLAHDFTVLSQHYDFLSTPFLQVVEEFKQVCLNFQLVETTTRQILNGLQEFEGDVGIMYLDDNNRKILERRFQQEGFSFEVLGQFATRIFLRKDHPLADNEVITREQLAAYPQVRFRQEEQGSGYFEEDPLEIAREVFGDRSSRLATDELLDGSGAAADSAVADLGAKALADPAVAAADGPLPTLYTNDRGTLMNLLCQSDAYASGLGIVDGFVKEHICLRPLAGGMNHQLIAVFNDRRQRSAMTTAFLSAVKEGLVRV